MIKGIPVKLYERTASGTDTFGHPIYTETPVTVEDVLVAPASTTEVLDMLNITGKKQSTISQFQKEIRTTGKTVEWIFWHIMASNWIPTARN